MFLGLQGGQEGGGWWPKNGTWGAGSSDIPTPSLQTEGKIPEEAFKEIP